MSLPYNDSQQLRLYHRKSPRIPGFSYIWQISEGISHAGPKPGDATIWYNTEKNISSAEVACVRMADKSRCTTRVLPEPGIAKDLVHKRRPNVLVVLMDPMSRAHFDRSMPKTRQKLSQLGFLSFPNYTAVGSNSGPNQAALYSGYPLGDRDFVDRDGNHGLWLWDRLRAAGYKTLKIEDGCVENSNMMQRLQPKTTHGDALRKLFCFDFDRPNCIGPDLASAHLLHYAEQFMDAYDGVSPWAGFVHFVDSHEDTMILAGAIDRQISDFLARLEKKRILNNAFVIFCSDHGLHYGPYFQASSGRREATEPLLFLRLPLSSPFRLDMLKVLEKNRQLWTTAYDVHETILNITGTTATRQKTNEATDRIGSSLFDDLSTRRRSCWTTTEIPKKYCALHDEFALKSKQDHRKCKRMPQPPSVLSYYADIPLINRPSHPSSSCQTQEETKQVSRRFRFGADCVCATSHRLWYSCRQHPWGSAGIKSRSHPDEHFAMIKCMNQKMVIDTRIVRRESLMMSRRSQPVKKRERVGRGGGGDVSPSILFIEIDSASAAYADRHFPLTREFLKKHRIRKESAAPSCAGGICAAEFPIFSVVGPNSIANQVAALSGCVVTRFHQSCFANAPTALGNDCTEIGMYTTHSGTCASCPKGMFLSDPLSSCSPDASSCCTSLFSIRNESRICHDESMLENGLQLFRRGPRRHTTWCPIEAALPASPFLFDVAKENGYVTFFGEEMCYEKSLYVTQNNVFPLSTDFDLQNIYCRLQDNQEHNGDEIFGTAFCAEQHASHGESLDNPGLDHIINLWSEYKGVPKFAFMNVIAPHDYSFNWMQMVSQSEAYDSKLVRFLKFMTSRENFSNTIIILRADHGLQGGPATVEYSVQTEHREPWTQIILPQALDGIALDALYKNQDNLATGYDLYKTILDLMSSTRKSVPVAPDWSVNLLQSAISEYRTCWDAKIPEAFCPCQGEGSDFAPNFGVCNLFDPYNDMYCDKREETILPALLEL